MATILVVDDERLICDLFRTVFACHGHDVLTASTGREALDLFEQHRPQFTLLDLHVNDPGGIEALKQIRALDPQAAVMILTELGTEKLESQARELGATDFLNKNLSLDVLTKAVERALKKPVQARPPSLVPGENPQLERSEMGEAESILVVDDEPQIRDLLKGYLSVWGYQVRVAQDGPHALSLVDLEIPQLIILDMNMPGMNGVEVLRNLRAKQYAGWVILLTGSQDEKLLKEALDIGSVDLMAKPVDLERLLLAVQVGCSLAHP